MPARWTAHPHDGFHKGPVAVTGPFAGPSVGFPEWGGQATKRQLQLPVAWLATETSFRQTSYSHARSLLGCYTSMEGFIARDKTGFLLPKPVVTGHPRGFVVGFRRGGDCVGARSNAKRLMYSGR